MKLNQLGNEIEQKNFTQINYIEKNIYYLFGEMMRTPGRDTERDRMSEIL